MRYAAFVLVRIFFVILLGLAGCFAAETAAWNFGAWLTNDLHSPSAFVSHTLALLGAAGCMAILFVTNRYARLGLWIVVPLMLYAAIVLGFWNGFGSGFSSFRLEAIKHGEANLYTLDHMDAHNASLTCGDARVTIAPDAHTKCATLLGTRSPH